MKQLILLTAVFMISTVTLADDTTATETCANGAGEIVTGVVTGHKYCKSNVGINWWNANAWCDAQGRRLFSMDDCAFSSTSGTSKCHDLKGVGSDRWIWTAIPKKDFDAYVVNLSSGDIGSGVRLDNNYYALCY